MKENVSRRIDVHEIHSLPSAEQTSLISVIDVL